MDKETAKISDYLTVDDASNLLGVCKETLRRWDRSGKLKSIRNPLNGYRLYKKEELEKLLNQLSEGLEQ